MTGKTPFTGKMPSFSISAPKLSNVLPAKKENAYKWTDANGVVHYSSEPPELAQTAEILELDPNANIIQGLPERQEAETNKQKPSAPALPQGNPYNPATVKKLIDDAKNVQTMLNKRGEEMNKL